MTMIYIIGSLRNDNVPLIGNRIRELGIEAFDDWFSPGERADDEWKDYEQARGHTYLEALAGYAARHVFEFDHHHLNRADMGLLICPAGKSCHLELGYLAGQGKPTFILLDKEDVRWDVMYQFATKVTDDIDMLLGAIMGEAAFV